jgi:hypothetical protein
MNRLRIILDTIVAGAIIGALLPAAGVLILCTTKFSLFNLQTLFESGVMLNLLKICLLLNLAPFFLFIYLNMDRASKGVLLSTILYGIALVIYILT